MTYSGVDDNWLRVKIMFAVAKSMYMETKHNPSRERMKTIEFPEYFFDANVHDVMQRERCIVESVMVWSVIVLEAMVNHAIVEHFNGSREVKIKAIEDPKKLAKDKSSVSDLERKLALLNGGPVPDCLKNSVCKIVQVRNSIVHDKPFDITNTEDDVEFFEYTNKTKTGGFEFPEFPELKAFFQLCSMVTDFLGGVGFHYSGFKGDVDFKSFDFD